MRRGNWQLEWTAGRPFLARTTEVRKDSHGGKQFCNHTLVVPHELGVREGAPCLGICSLSGGQTTRTMIGSTRRCRMTPPHSITPFASLENSDKAASTTTLD